MWVIVRSRPTTEQAAAAAGAQGAVGGRCLAAVNLRLAWRSCDRIGRGGV